MKIFLCYGYRPHTTAVYFEKALCQEHEVFYIGPGFGNKPGYMNNENLFDLIQNGLPEPDLILFIDPGFQFFPRGLEKMKCPTAIYLIDVHCHTYYRELMAPFFDFIFVAQHDYVSHFQQLGHVNVTWLPLACDPDIHSLARRKEIWDVGFVGNLNSANRVRRLKRVASQFKVNDYLRFYHKEEIGKVYSQSKIVLNSSVNGDLNMRVFEAMASGALLITDKIKNGQQELFKDRQHLVEYTDDSSLIEAIEYYLAHDEERRQIAQAGKHSVLSQHTYWHRCQTILSTIFGETAFVPSAKMRESDETRISLGYAKIYSQVRGVDPMLDLLQTQWGKKGFIKILALVFVTLLRRLSHIIRNFYKTSK